MARPIPPQIPAIISKTIKPVMDIVMHRTIANRAPIAARGGVAEMVPRSTHFEFREWALTPQQRTSNNTLFPPKLFSVPAPPRHADRTETHSARSLIFNRRAAEAAE